MFALGEDDKQAKAEGTDTLALSKESNEFFLYESHSALTKVSCCWCW
jgi:hypothetical protein